MILGSLIPHIARSNVVPSYYYGTDKIFSTLSKTKTLTKIAVLGDSLMGNELGGAIPAGKDEGSTLRPIRLTVNNISRRLYDLLSFNKATHVRLDNAAWTKSGTWTTLTTMWEPAYSNEVYHSASTSGAYAEITVPAGKENFAVVLYKTASQGSLNITLNGGSIASYGPSSISLSRTAIAGEQLGNPYYIVQFNNLPAGANTIRFTLASSTATRIWGGFYWSGCTMVVHNLGHGGHTFQELMDQHLAAEFGENNYDAVLFEMTEMNELSHQASFMTQSPANLQTLINTYLIGKDCCIMSTNPLGTNPATGTPNYYTSYPGHKELNATLKATVLQNSYPFIDVFSHFEKLIIDNGGTLASGTAAGLYTLDGQHPNPTGVDTWWNLIKPALSNNPLTA